MDILVSDTSVIIDLERAQLIEEIFSLPFRFVVPGALFEREMRDYGGEKLVALGLEVWNLTGTQVQEAQRLRGLERRISVHDSYALALAKAEGAVILTGDGALRVLAEAQGVRCHGVLWIFDQLEDKRAVSRVAIYNGLSRLAAHLRCRLPREEIDLRLTRLSTHT